jgi:hypothetical protein
MDRVRPVPSRGGPVLGGANGGTDSIFSNLVRLESARVDCGPSEFGPDQTVFKSLPGFN